MTKIISSYNLDFIFLIHDLNNLEKSNEDFERSRAAVNAIVDEILSTIIRQLENRIEKGTNIKNVTPELIESKRQEIFDRAIDTINKLEVIITQQKVVLNDNDIDSLSRPLHAAVRLLTDLVNY
jgi:hypothetical protein